jgi:hypothetical protein
VSSSASTPVVTIWMPAITKKKPPKNIGRVPMEAPVKSLRPVR